MNTPFGPVHPSRTPFRFVGLAFARLLVLLVPLGLALGACGGPSTGGGGGGSGLAITEASAPTSTSMVVAFSEAVTGGADATENYTVVTPDGTPLKVVAAYLDEAGTTATLATAPQATVDYQLSAANLATARSGNNGRVDAPSSVAGSNVAAPIVASAVALSNTEVLVTFQEPATAQVAVMGESANDARFYRIVDPPLAVESAALQEGGGSVILTTASQTRDTYRLEVTNVVTAEDRRLVDPFANTAQFPGIAPQDDVPPAITDALAPDPTTVILSLSEPVEQTAADRTSYSIRDPADIELPVLDAALDSFGTTVTLTTSAQTAGVQYSVLATGLTDLAGNTPSGGADATFVGASDGSEDTVPPRVLGATSLGNTAVVINYSEPVDRGSAEIAENYSIFRDGGGNLEAQAILIVTGATLNPDGRSVTLSTLSQSDIEYTVQITNVKDLAGNFIAPPDRDNPFAATFRGTAPGVGDATDSDGDGLNDDVEQRGWTVTVTLEDGSTTSREVTSDPGDPSLPVDDPVNVAARDTDGDGLLDAEERTLATDPRSADTDDDDLNDYDEFNRYGTDTEDQDSDDDGLTDGLEIDLYFTNPTQDDTDGDSFYDGDEIAIDDGQRRAILADIPRFDTTVSEVALQLDYRFNETTGTTTTTGAAQQTNRVSLSSTTDSSSQQNSYSQNWFVNAGTEVCWGGSCDTGGESPLGVWDTFGAKLSVNVGTGGESAFVSTAESARTVQNEYAKTLATTEEVSAETVVTREVFGATMLVDVTFENTSPVAFELSDLEFTAQVIDPSDPRKLRTVGTLVPQDADLVVALGPEGSPQEVKGPLVFRTEGATPSVIEELMRDPRTITVKLANYNVNLDTDRNYVFDLQNVTERTAQIEIDYAGRLEAERINPATYAGFDELGVPVGVTLGYVMERILGLTHETAAPTSDGRGCTESTPVSEWSESYATCAITVDGTEVEALWRVRGVSREDAPDATSWWVLTPDTGLITPVPEAPDPWTGTDFRSYAIRSGQAFVFKFVKDADFDRLDASFEARLGTSDSNVDSDGDTIPDGLEVYGPVGTDGRTRGWPIEIDGITSYTSANPARADGDLDGLSDCQELLYSGGTVPCDPIEVYQDGNTMSLTGTGTPYASDVALAAATDPSDPDSDDDGLEDGTEVAGLIYEGVDDNLQPTTIRVRPDTSGARPAPAIDPLTKFTDADVLDDYRETRLGTDPTVDDGDKVLDDDGDGLVNLRERLGQDIFVVRNGVEVAGRAVSSETDPDSDDDGLSDWEEYNDCWDRNRDFRCDSTAHFNPAQTSNGYVLRSVPMTQTLGSTSIQGGDSDGDGLDDFEEVEGEPFRSGETRRTFPAKSDSDADGRSDFEELREPLQIEVAGKGVYSVVSDPRVANEDGDGWNDGEETVAYLNAFDPSERGITDPTKFDTDGDEGVDAVATGDDEEWGICGGFFTFKCRNPLVPDHRGKIEFVLNVFQDGDSAATGDGDFSYRLRVSFPDGRDDFFLSGQSFQGDNTVVTLVAPTFVLPYDLNGGTSKNITVSVEIWEDDATVDICRKSDSRAITPPLDPGSNFSMSASQGHIGGDCSYRLDVRFSRD